jgi:hypothetical protein
MEQINLFKDPRLFNALPKSVKNGILFLLVAWAAHFFLFYRIFQSEIPTQMFYQQLAIAVMSCFFVTRLRNWARVLTIVGNSLIILMYLFIMTIFYTSGKVDLLLLSGLNIVLFGLSIYFLARSEASEFFKLQSPKTAEDGGTENGNPGGASPGGEGNK